MKEQLRTECIIRGRVQLVMFRDFVARQARRLGLTGLVRNLPDGSVYVVAEGKKTDVERLEEALRRGPIMARVDFVDVKHSAAMGEFQDFAIDDR